MLYIHDWDEWQTYRSDRGQPPWIKVHRCLMRKPKWVGLTDKQRGQLVMLWLLAADNDGWIPHEPDILKRLCFMTEKPDVEFFINQGFIDDPDSLTSTRRQGDVTEAEEETEAETEKNRRSSKFDEKYPLYTGRGFEYPEEFEQIWKLWPNRSGKAQGYKRWRNLLRENEATVDELYKACQNYAEEQKDNDPRYTKHLATFLGPDQHFVDYIAGKVFEEPDGNSKKQGMKALLEQKKEAGNDSK